MRMVHARMDFIVGLLSLLLVAPTAHAVPSASPSSDADAGLPLFTVQVAPTGVVPLGNEASPFGFGGGAALTASYRLPPLPFLYAGCDLGYSFVSTNAPDTSVSLVTLGGQAGVHLQIGAAFWGRAYGEAGYFLATLNESGATPGYNPYFGGGLSMGLDVVRNLSITAGVGYRYCAALFGGLTGGLGVAYRFPVGKSSSSLPAGFQPVRNDGRGLKLYGIKLESVFPVFYKYYDDHPIGGAVLHNYETVPAGDLKVYVNVKQYMDNPKECKVPVNVRPGANGDVVLYGLFADKILEVAEATKVSLSLTVEYRAVRRPASRRVYCNPAGAGPQRAHVERRPQGSGIRIRPRPAGPVLRQGGRGCHEKCRQAWGERKPPGCHGPPSGAAPRRHYLRG